MQFKPAFTGFRINFSKYHAALQAALMDKLAYAAAEFVRAATSVIPVWSGASVATFLHLAYAASYSLPTPSPVHGAPNRVSLGLAEGGGYFDVSASDGRFSFTYWTTLPHLIINEYYDATQWGFNLITPGPYLFQHKAKLASTKILVSAALPNPFDSLTLKRL